MSKKKPITKRILEDAQKNLDDAMDEMSKEHDDEIAAINYLRNSPLNEKKLGDRVWYVDYASRETQPAWMFEERFISFDKGNGNVLTLRDGKVFIHEEEDVFGYLSDATGEMERFCKINDALSEIRRRDRKKRRTRKHS